MPVKVYLEKQDCFTYLCILLKPNLVKNNNPIRGINPEICVDHAFTLGYLID
jgi:hypothetical protein